MASEQSGRSTLSSNFKDDNFSFLLSKFAGYRDYRLISLTIIKIKEMKINVIMREIVVGDGCFDDHDIKFQEQEL